MKLLIVDDEWELSEVLARFLTHSGHHCLTALDVQRAIDAITQHRPDLVLTDFRLPDGDGLQVINQIRQILPHTPVIVMTGYHVSGMEEMVRRAGATDYLRKPFALKELTRAIDAAAYGRRP